MRKASPLARITDLALTQGPLLRMLGLWRLDIQTAGTGQQMAEGYLYGLVNPDETRTLLLERRNLNSQ
jgi:putative membrane protein